MIETELCASSQLDAEGQCVMGHTVDPMVMRICAVFSSLFGAQ